MIILGNKVYTREELRRNRFIRSLVKNSPSSTLIDDDTDDMSIERINLDYFSMSAMKV